MRGDFRVGQMLTPFNALDKKDTSPTRRLEKVEDLGMDE